MLSIVWLFLVILVMLVIAYVLLVCILRQRLEAFMFGTRPAYDDCDKRLVVDGRCPWRWVDIDDGVAVWDTVQADNPSLPVLVIASGLYVHWAEQRQFMKFLVKQGYRVIIVFYALYEGAGTKSRVHDFDTAYRSYIAKQVQDDRSRRRPHGSRDPNVILLGISYGCTVLTHWLDSTVLPVPTRHIQRLVLLHPVVSFWNACAHIVPGMTWFIKDQVSLMPRIAQVADCYPTSVVCAKEDMFTNNRDWVQWCRNESQIDCVSLQNRRNYNPYEQHFYARYGDWADWKHLI